MKNRRYAGLALCLSLLIGLSACGSRETEPQGTSRLCRNRGSDRYRKPGDFRRTADRHRAGREGPGG